MTSTSKSHSVPADSEHHVTSMAASSSSSCSSPGPGKSSRESDCSPLRRKRLRLAPKSASTTALTLTAASSSRGSKHSSSVSEGSARIGDMGPEQVYSSVLSTASVASSSPRSAAYGRNDLELDDWNADLLSSSGSGSAEATPSGQRDLATHYAEALREYGFEHSEVRGDCVSVRSSDTESVTSSIYSTATIGPEDGSVFAERMRSRRRPPPIAPPPVPFGVSLGRGTRGHLATQSLFDFDFSAAPALVAESSRPAASGRHSLTPSAKTSTAVSQVPSTGTGVRKRSISVRQKPMAAKTTTTTITATTIEKKKTPAKVKRKRSLFGSFFSLRRSSSKISKSEMKSESKSDDSRRRKSRESVDLTSTIRPLPITETRVVSGFERVFGSGIGTAAIPPPPPLPSVRKRSNSMLESSVKQMHAFPSAPKLVAAKRSVDDSAVVCGFEAAAKHSAVCKRKSGRRRGGLPRAKDRESGSGRRVRSGALKRLSAVGVLEEGSESQLECSSGSGRKKASMPSATFSKSAEDRATDLAARNRAKVYSRLKECASKAEALSRLELSLSKVEFRLKEHISEFVRLKSEMGAYQSVEKHECGKWQAAGNWELGSLCRNYYSNLRLLLEVRLDIAKCHCACFNDKRRQLKSVATRIRRLMAATRKAATACFSLDDCILSVEAALMSASNIRLPDAVISLKANESALTAVVCELKCKYQSSKMDYLKPMSLADRKRHLVTLLTQTLDQRMADERTHDGLPYFHSRECGSQTPFEQLLLDPRFEDAAAINAWRREAQLKVSRWKKAQKKKKSKCPLTVARLSTLVHKCSSQLLANCGIDESDAFWRDSFFDATHLMVCRCVFPRVRGLLQSVLYSDARVAGSERRYAAQLRWMKRLSARQLGVAKALRTEGDAYAEAVFGLSAASRETVAQDFVFRLIGAIHALHKGASHLQPTVVLSGDVLFPIVVHCVLQCAATNWHSQVAFTELFYHSDVLSFGQSGYCFALLKACLSYVLDQTPEDFTAM